MSSYQTPTNGEPSTSRLLEGLTDPRSDSVFSRSKSPVGVRNTTIAERFRGCLPDLSTRQWCLLAVFALADLIAGIVYNIKGPFYPKEAEKKGVTPTQYGFVFGIFDATKVFVCPILGRYMFYLGPKKVFISSMMLISGCSILFGLLDKINSTTVFLALSLIIRVLEAIGSAGFSTSTFSIIACEFPSTVATTFASLETFFGIGLIIGPLLGGLFFQIGGYDAPFIVTGLLFFIMSLFILSCMPYPTSSPLETSTISQESKPEEGYSVFSVLCIPGIMLSGFGVFVTASSAGFLNSTLEPHIRQFNLSPEGVALVFVIWGTVYALTAPIWGWICDRVGQPKFITLTGGILNFFAFLLIGPAPFIPVEPILWLTCVGLVLHGLALGAIFVSGFVLSLRYAIANGFPNNMATYGVVSGTWTSILSLGMFFGPVLGGILLDQVGFRWGSVFVLVSMLLLIVLIVAYLLTHGVHIIYRNIEIPEAIQPLLKAIRGGSRSSANASMTNSTEGEETQDQIIVNYGSNI